MEFDIRYKLRSIHDYTYRLKASFYSYTYLRYIGFLIPIKTTVETNVDLY